MPIDSGGGLSAEVAITRVEIERTDAAFAASTLELYSSFYPIGSVVCHCLIVVFLLGGKDAPRWAVEGNEFLRSLSTTVVTRLHVLTAGQSVFRTASRDWRGPRFHLFAIRNKRRSTIHRNKINDTVQRSLPASFRSSPLRASVPCQI